MFYKTESLQIYTNQKYPDEKHNEPEPDLG